MLLKSSETKELPTHPVFEGLLEDLKDPKCFMSIENKIDKIMYYDHKHKTLKAFVNCKRCQEKLNKKRDFIHKSGFKDIRQYQMWKRIMGIIHKAEDFQVK